MRRPSKAPRLESFLFDDVPTREIPGPSIGKCLMQELLSLQAVAIALCGGAHLHTLKEMNRRFVNRCFERYPAESMLRGPTVEEAQIADQRGATDVAHATPCYPEVMDFGRERPWFAQGWW